MRISSTLLGMLYSGGDSQLSPSQNLLNQPGYSSFEDVCPLAPKVTSTTDGLSSSVNFLQDPAIRLTQVHRLAKAVQIPTISTELEDDPWSDFFAPFLDFHSVLVELFPLTHSSAKLEKINRLGLVYVLNGTDSTLKPVLLTAHQDVVPPGNINDWTYPPFSAHFDGQWMWGRGTVDCKNVLIGILSAVEHLLYQGWTPTRSLILGFGYDEESGGRKGAREIARYLENQYGHGSIEFLLDEGGMGLQTLGDKVYALPGVGEKGMISLNFALSVKGGHSSVPPAHTAIGVMAEIICHMERQDLFTARLDFQHPSRQVLECQARHSARHVEPWLWSALQSDDYEGVAERLAESRGNLVRFTYQTSQATDLIHGGVKINALPENVEATINYRVAIHDSNDSIKARAIDIASPIAKSHNLTFAAFGSDRIGNGPNHLNLTLFGASMEPAPVSPTNVTKDAVWARFAGVIRSVFESTYDLQGKQVIVAGDLMTGNTDTRYYWNLTQNIYRFSARRANHALNLHAADERIDIDVHLEGLALYYGECVSLLTLDYC